MHASISLSILSALVAGLGASRTNTGHEDQAATAPASLAFGDYDGDGLLDALAIGAEGNLRLLRNLGDGSFDDVSVATGLSSVRDASLVLWEDYDRDGRADLLVTTACGPRVLLRSQAGGLFEDVSASSGLGGEGCGERFAQWMDYDKDGRLDLHLEGAAGGRLYHALPDGRFEPLVLGAEHAIVDPRPLVFVTETGDGDAGRGTRGTRPENEAGRTRRIVIPAADVAALTSSRAGPTPAGGAQALVVASGCAHSIKDQANPSTCVQASTTPALGELYPLSTNLNVSGAGNVGIGTTTPSAKLEVAGTARVTDTLTLNPSGDQALNVSTGSIYKGGAPFIHTKGGIQNTAVGRDALFAVLSFGVNNTAFGDHALFHTTSGVSNTATGNAALLSNTSGNKNTASGDWALFSNTTGNLNTASGANALAQNTIGDFNTASGYRTLGFNTTGNSNTASGTEALLLNTSGNSNTASGYQALRNNTTASLNTATGFEALQANTTGAYNTASGALALYSNTTGINNTASGANALLSNTTGNSNTASGYQALRNNTTASLNTATGYGALQANTTGAYNTANGAFALNSNVVGINNTACGYRALFASDANDNTAVGHRALTSNSSGFRNTAIGYEALDANTSGSKNTASGDRVLLANTTGSRNTASGMQALTSNTTGTSNTASGYQSLFANTTGGSNIALGALAGSSLTTGNDNIDIGNIGVAAEAATIRIGTAGTHTKAFVAGIFGKTVSAGTGTAVFVDSAGQLGTTVSSRRFKEEIQDMGDRTDRLLALRPVTFRYKPEVQAGERPLEYGLIAEEVAEVFPDLVVYDDEGKPFTVKYHLLSSMLLNELEKQQHELEEQGTRLKEQQGQLAEQRDLWAEQQEELSRLRELEARLAALEALDPSKSH